MLVGIDVGFGLGARMGDRSLLGRTNGLRVLPDGTGLIFMAAASTLSAARPTPRRSGHRDGPSGVDLDHIAVLQQADRATHRRFRADVADAEATGRAGEAAVGDQRHLIAQSLAVKCRRRRQHLPHARATLRTLIANDEYVARLVVALLDAGERVLLAIEADRLAAELQRLEACNLHNAAFQAGSLSDPRHRLST